MVDRRLARVAILTAVIGIHLTNVLAEEQQAPSGADGDYEGEYFDTVLLSKNFFSKIQDESELFGSLVSLISYNPKDEDIDPDLHHCIFVKKGAADDLLWGSIDLFVDHCVKSLKILEEVVINRLKAFLEAVKSLDHLAFEDALACVQLGHQINYEPVLQCLDKVLSYRELSFYDYLEEMRHNYMAFNRRAKKLNECGEEVKTMIEDDIQTILLDINKCVHRIENTETFFEETFDESGELSGDQRKAVITNIVTFSLSIIMERIEELNQQLKRKHHHDMITDLLENTENIIAGHKEKVDSIAKAAMVKVEDTERMGARFNQCTTMVGEETSIRATLAIASIHECMDEGKKIHKYFIDGISGYEKEIQNEFETQKELILTCTGKLIANMDSPTAEEVTQTVNCIKFKLLFNSDKSLVDLEEKMQKFLSTTREKWMHFDNSIEKMNICTGAAVFNFEEIMKDNADLIDLCVEEKSSQISEKDEL